MTQLNISENSAPKTAVSQHNQRIILNGIGSPEMLKLISEPMPEPQAGEARIRVLASGVAFADILCRTGKYPFMPKLPFTPGYDLVGVVDAVGDGVTELSVGQMVGALLPHFGANAAYVNVPTELLVPVPEGVDAAQAASLILNYLTAYRLLTVSAQAKAGERLLVHSAAGGVGTAVLQIGQILGLEMIGTASLGKLETVEQYGATAIDYKNEDFAQRIRTQFPEGIDIVLDPIGGETTKKSYRLLRSGGRLVSFGFMGATDGGKMAIVPSVLRVLGYKLRPDGKKSMMYGSTPTIAEKENDWYREALSTLFSWLANGRISPVIGAQLPLSEAPEAHRLLETSSVIGKIVLTNI